MLKFCHVARWYFALTHDGPFDAGGQYESLPFRTSDLWQSVEVSLGKRFNFNYPQRGLVISVRMVTTPKQAGGTLEGEPAAVHTGLSRI